MKKYVIFILFAGCISFASAQDRVQNLGDVSEIKVFNGLSIKIERSNEAKVEITGKKADDVVIKNVDGTLKLSLKLPEIFNSDDVSITVFYKDDLTVIDANEGSVIISKESIDQEKLTLKVQEGAYIKTPLKTKYLDIKAVTGGSIEVTGSTENQDVDVNTGGVYEAYDLQSTYADVTAASGGRAEITVSNLLDAKVNFGGSVFYKGNPEKVTTKKVLGGNIINKE